MHADLNCSVGGLLEVPFGMPKHKLLNPNLAPSLPISHGLPSPPTKSSSAWEGFPTFQSQGHLLAFADTWTTSILDVRVWKAVSICFKVEFCYQPPPWFIAYNLPVSQVNKCPYNHGGSPGAEHLCPSPCGRRILGVLKAINVLIQAKKKFWIASIRVGHGLPSSVRLSSFCDYQGLFSILRVISDSFLLFTKVLAAICALRASSVWAI